MYVKIIFTYIITYSHQIHAGKFNKKYKTLWMFRNY